ncbi:ring finger domain-containing protein [Colletotrichum incanum]|uniref:Ring finger domain-containing protein n=1 Tax=Colletotrichum incanum TaxID=1573173 RepID=A0A167E903_COLIC|nr:ring finger domain-containing protein [Colletotrichum incanum]OHW92051.1 RING domain-containing protein [Colletotrichum incanum]
MASMLFRSLACAAAVVMAQAATITPENEVPSWTEKSAMQMSLSTTGGAVPLTFIVIPSTERLGLNQTDIVRGAIRIEGTMIPAASSNYNSINGDDVAYLSCDAPGGGGFINPDMMLGTLMENKPKAIVLYSTVGNWCMLSSDTELPYYSIFTMADAGDSQQALRILNLLNGTNEADQVRVTITGNATANTGDGGNGGGGNNSAVAMSILYSITGLITLLFLIIIATGAVRAHRYPERYGPRNGFNGRPRQSRAKGLARAVLDTLPIVKFGERQEAKPDPNMELESATNVPTNDRSIESRSEDRQLDTVPVSAKNAETTTMTTTTGHTVADGATATAAGAVAATTAAAVAAGTADANNTAGSGNHESSGQEDENLGCSICTEDFTVGEDVRVLPCNHKFHPNCVDPWLVNVSGTCPLCRLDLRPQGGAENTSDELPPPLELDGHESDGSSTTQRRRTRLFDLNRLRNASAEERIQALRQYRTQHQGQGAPPDAADAERDERNDRSRRARLADKLRDKFRIRTGPQS